MTLRIAVDPHKSSWTATLADASLHELAMPRGAGQPRRLPGIALLRALLGAPAVRDRKVAGLGAPPDHATARRSLECRCIGTESRSVANGHLGAESRCIRRRAARPTGARSGRWSPVSHAPPVTAAQAERFPPRLIRAVGVAQPMRTHPHRTGEFPVATEQAARPGLADGRASGRAAQHPTKHCGVANASGRSRRR